MYVRSISPARGLSPVKPKITFNYQQQPSPLRQRPSYGNSLFAPKSFTTLTPISPNGASQVSPSSFINHGNLINGGNQISQILSPVSKIKEDFVSEAHRQKQQDCFRCSAKQISYRSISGLGYCSPCAVFQISQGKQLTRIKLTDQPFFRDYNKKDKENVFTQGVAVPVECGVNNQEREGELNDLIQKVQQERYELQRILIRLNSQELARDGVKFIYRNRKLALKKHYQKIKQAIKVSIQKDLQQLQRRQAQSLNHVEQNRRQLTHNIAHLDKIHSDIEPNMSQILNITQKDYRGLIQRHNVDRQKINGQKQMSLKLVGELAVTEGQCLGSKEWQERVQGEVQQGQGVLYEPGHFRMFGGKGRGRAQTLFSFEGQMH